MLRPHLRLYTIFLAVGGFAAVAVPFAVRAQSGDALAHAEQICLDHGLGPNSVAFDTCVERAAAAYDRGAPRVADHEARLVADAREACMSYEIQPMTLGYRACVANETRRAEAAPEIAAVPDDRSANFQ